MNIRSDVKEAFSHYLGYRLLNIRRPNKAVWHGAGPNGEPAMDAYCDAWHSTSGDKFGLASSLHSNKLLDQET